MNIDRRAISRLAVRCATWGCCVSALACGGADVDPSLVTQRDSAGVQIVEAFRPAWGDSSRWTVDPEPILDLTRSGTGESHEFFRVGAMTRLSDGRVVVSGQQEIRLYAAAGEFLGSFGREGEGPGEFRQIWGMERVSGDTLLLLDYDERITVVTPDLTLSRTFSLPLLTDAIYDLGGGTLLVELGYGSMTTYEGTGGLRREPWPLWRFDLHGTRIDSIGESEGFEELMITRGESLLSTLPFFARVSQVATRGGTILRGSADAMEVEELAATGELIRIIRLPDYPLELTPDEIDAARESLGENPGSVAIQMFEAMSGMRPAYADIMVDPSGAIWLERYRGRHERESPQSWLVLDHDGTWLGQLVMPAGFNLHEVQMDALLGVRIDALDVEHPQVLRLRRNRAPAAG
ncbi:hypothetical protein [Candidatus Palauibacter sp.]|uniref:hypothetical protein n=1 Tax=Candidatus Palauibacter sp. TaxID=3101350 RepID=UPI003B0167C9